MHLAHLDGDVGKGLCLAKERIALRLVDVGQIGGVHRAVVHLALEDRAAAGAADAGAAAIGQHVPGIEPRLQDALALLDFVGMPAGHECYAISHELV